MYSSFFLLHNEVSAIAHAHVHYFKTLYCGILSHRKTFEKWNHLELWTIQLHHLHIYSNILIYILLTRVQREAKTTHLKRPRYPLTETQSQNNLMYVIVRLGTRDNRKSTDLQLLPAVFVVWKWPVKDSSAKHRG